MYSVYGASDAARRPPADVMKRLDAVVFDIQDADVRFYTYETTLGYFLEAAAAASVEVIVLDRPNPVTGSFVQGPVSDAERESFTNYWTVPVRHGMTMGELAKMFNAERKINAKLTVVPMEIPPIRRHDRNHNPRLKVSPHGERSGCLHDNQYKQALGGRSP